MILKKAIKQQSSLHRFEFECQSKDILYLLNTSDWHFDNPKCRRQLLFSHLDEVKEKGGFIHVNGDTLCLMQGRYDPRGSKSQVRLEHQVDNYLDAVINDTAEKLVPYAHNILMISKGNHETSVSKRAETDVMQRLVERINTLAGSNIQMGAYSGMYTLSMKYKGGANHNYRIAYHHGLWGGVITKGTLSVVRLSSIYPDADMIVSGHTHDGWIVQHPRFKLTSNGTKLKVVNQRHVKSGTYKEEYEGGNGFAVQRIGMPKFLGSVMTEIYYSKKKGIKTRCYLME